MVTYDVLKRTIINQKHSGKLDATDMIKKLDAFLLYDRINDTEYQELAALVYAE